MEPDWLDEREARAWRAFIEMTELLRAQLGRELQRSSGLSDADYVVLVQLSESPDHRLRMNDLARQLLWSRSRLSHQIGRMADRGLVERQTCPTDARGTYAVLTPTGLGELQKAAPDHVGSVRRHLLDQLTPEQLDHLAEISETVRSHLVTAAPGPEECPPEE